MNIGVIGAGRIGKVHAQNIAQFVPELTIKTLADPFADNEIKAFAERYNINVVSTDADDILQDDDIEAVLICSSTDTHSKYIIESARAGKHIFCEKPIDYDLDKARESIKVADDAKVKLG